MGGVRPWKDAEGKDIARKVNWVGFGPTKRRVKNKTYAEVTFSEFYLYDENGPLFFDVAPKLAARMYGTGAKQHVRILLNLTQEEHAEARGVLEFARTEWRNLEITGSAASSRKRAKRCS